MNRESAIKIPLIPAEEQLIRIEEKLGERVKFQLLADKDYQNKVLLTKMCSDDFIFWCNNFVWIQDPEAIEFTQKEIPFILYDFQERAAIEIIKAIENGYDIPIEKTRKMGLSWLIISILVWGWHFHQWECLVGSQKAENVDMRGNIKSLLEKARFILRRSPGWLIQPLKEKIHDKSMHLLHPSHGSSIAGESNNPNFGRSDRRKVILFDEFASWEQTDKSAWQSCSATTKCRIALSTPNTRGTNCFYYEIIKSAYRKKSPVLRLHWTLHPLFAHELSYDELGRPHSPWYDREVKRASSTSEVAQELDIDYDAAAVGKVFPSFSSSNVLDNISYDDSLPMYYAWDFGLDATSILFIQINTRGHVYNKKGDIIIKKGDIIIIDEYENSGKGAGKDIYHYLDVLDSKGYKSGIHFGDPHSGENHSLTSGTSNANILRKSGIIFKCQRARIKARVGAGRNILDKVKVGSHCILTLEMFNNWQLRSPRSGMMQGGEVPEHDEYSHIGEAYTYFAYNYINPNNKAKIKKTVRQQTLSGVMM